MKKENAALLEEYKTLRMEVLGAVQHFPENRREESLFSGRSLKDLLAHITSWDSHVYESIENLLEGVVPVQIENSQIDSFNNAVYLECKDLSWETVHENFIEAGARVIDVYKSLPEELWDKALWENSSVTPRSLLHTDVISHYKNDHLPEIMRFVQ